MPRIAEDVGEVAVAGAAAERTWLLVGIDNAGREADGELVMMIADGAIVNRTDGDAPMALSGVGAAVMIRSGGSMTAVGA